MKLWVLFAVHFEHEWGHGLDEVVGAALDEEEATEIARRMSVAYYRAHPDELARLNKYTLQQWGLDGVELDDDTLIAVIEDAGSQRFEVRELDVADALDLSGLGARDRRDAVRGLAALLRPLHPGAATALEEEAS